MEKNLGDFSQGFNRLIILMVVEYTRGARQGTWRITTKRVVAAARQATDIIRET